MVMKRFQPAIRITTALAAVLFLALSTGCNPNDPLAIHEFPQGDGIDPTKVKLHLKYTFDLDIETFKTITPLQSPTRAAGLQMDARCVVEVNRVTGKDSKLVTRYVASKAQMTEAVTAFDTVLMLNAAKYKIAVWVDYVDHGTLSDKYFKTESLSAVTLNRNPYGAGNDDQDAFSGVFDIDLTPYAKQWNMSVDYQGQLLRPQAKIVVITTDVDEYLTRLGTRATDISSFTARISYQSNIPRVYSDYSGNPTDVVTGVGFTSNLQALSATEALMSTDYVLVNNQESEVSFNMDVMDQAGDVVKSIPITAPIARGKMTVIRGNFLTGNYNSPITIDPDFDKDKEQNIHIPD